MGIAAGALLVILLILILTDALKERKFKARSSAGSEEVHFRTARLAKVEAEVEEKFREIESCNRVSFPVDTSPASNNGSDPNSDTRYMQAVRLKADELERIAKERGITHA
jgi:uncharacterized membrane protein YhiD involved in acid resistance